ncbi:MAG: hypothetical protein WCC90_01895, partial [Methylocella sp.]
VVFRLMGVEIVEDDMDGCIRISGGDLIHEVEELDASTAALVGRRYPCAGIVLQSSPYRTTGRAIGR